MIASPIGKYLFLWELKLIGMIQSKIKHVKLNLQSNNNNKLKSERISIIIRRNFQNNQKILKEMCSDVSTFCKNENEMNQELGK